MSATESIWTKEKIHALLDRSPLAVQRAVLAVYARQTESEKQAQQTRLLNNVGFSAFDAEPMSRLAEAIRKGVPVSDRWLAYGRRRIKRYWRQLVEIANQNAVQPAVQAGQFEIQPAVPQLPQQPAPKRCDCEWGDGEPVACSGRCASERLSGTW